MATFEISQRYVRSVVGTRSTTIGAESFADARRQFDEGARYLDWEIEEHPDDVEFEWERPEIKRTDPDKDRDAEEVGVC